MTRRFLACLAAAALTLTSLGAVTVAGAQPTEPAAVDAAATKCPRAAVDRVTPGRLLKVRCAGGYAAGTTRFKGGKRPFLLKVTSGGRTGLQRLRGVDLSAACSRPGVPASIRGAGACKGLTALGDDACAPFPAGDVPPDPKNPDPPYGDPQKASSLTSMRTGLLGEAVKDKYSKNAVLCAEHPDDETAEDCDIAYWNPGGVPGQQQNCNFFYLRVGNEYWTGLTPIVLNQYGEYLGVTADGHDAVNQHAGPHTSITEYRSAQAFLQPQGQFGATFTLDGGALAARDVQQQLESALGNDVASSQLISPVLFHDQLQVDCTPAYQGGGSNWRQVGLATLPVTAGTSFTCAARAPGAGTAYVTAKLGAPSGGTVPAAVYVIVDSKKSNTLRKDPAKPFTADNVVWPNGLPEVKRTQAVPFSIDSTPTCLNDQTQDPESCLHLWVNKSQDQSGKPDGCQIWFVLELRSPQLLKIMAQYGLATTTALMRKQLAGYGFAGKGLRKSLAEYRDGGTAFTPHISLAKRRVTGAEVPPPWGKAAAGTRDVCTDAALLSQGKDALTPFVPTPS